jgi:hypothetical protein
MHGRHGLGGAMEIAKDLRSRYSFRALPVHCGFYRGSIVAWAIVNASFRPFTQAGLLQKPLTSLESINSIDEAEI